MIKSTQEIGNSYNPQLDQTPHCLLRALLVVFLPKTWVRICSHLGENSVPVPQEMRTSRFYIERNN